MVLTVIVPVYNEAPRLQDFLCRFFDVRLPVPREVIFVDDGSRDDSRRILADAAPRYGFRVLAQPENQGKGAAVRAGIEAATGDYILIQDADFEYDPAEIPRLLRPILQGRADVVYGSRFKRSGIQVHRTFHYSINRLLTFLSNILSGIYLTDMETCYKIFPRDLLQSMKLSSRRFGIEVEMTAYLARTSARVVELPISYRPRSRIQGKKIRWTDGLAALVHLVRYNLRSSRDCFDNLPERYRT